MDIWRRRPSSHRHARKRWHDMARSMLFTPSFRHDKLGWLFVAIVTIMVYIATLATAVEAALSSASLSRNEGVANHLTVEIPAVDDEATMSQPDRVKQA